MNKPRTILLTALALAAISFVIAAQDKPADDEWPERNPDAVLEAKQPEEGPGGKDYGHREVTEHEALENGERYWLYTPAEPAPERAPVIVFIHGFGALTPDSYDAWLHHLVKRGNIVIYPQYQAHALDPSKNWLPNIATSIKDALKYLEADDSRVQPDKTKFAIAGHSAGGVTAANLAADWSEHEIPEPGALMVIQPGRAFNHENSGQKSSKLIPFSEFENIPEDCLLLSIYSDSDHTVGAWCARKIFADATTVKPENKNLIEFVSDDYGREYYVAGHRSPAAPTVREEMIDHWDWHGYWKLLDGLTDAAFHGKNREYALGDTPEQKFMGKYDDGRPFPELKVWIGDAEIDADALVYRPAFDRNGKRTE